MTSAQGPSHQLVVAVEPSSTPASARRKVPVHAAATWAPASVAERYRAELPRRRWRIQFVTQHVCDAERIEQSSRTEVGYPVHDEDRDIHRGNGIRCAARVHLEKCYFTPRNQPLISMHTWLRALQSNRSCSARYSPAHRHRYRGGGGPTDPYLWFLRCTVRGRQRRAGPRPLCWKPS